MYTLKLSIELVIEYGSKLIKGCKESSIRDFSDQYMCDAINLSWGITPYITDKLCFNFLAVPLLAASYPNARFVNVQRDRDAVKWSQFKRYFPSNNVGFSSSFADMDTYFDMYYDLMERWNTLYDIHTVQYEALVLCQEDETRNLIKYVGLDWEEKCLYPHKNNRIVNTYSAEQVKKPVYKGSNEAWKKFEKYINAQNR